MERLFWICLGGATGTAARYGIGVWAAGRFTGGLPAGTILVNLIGCFAIALIMAVSAAFEWSATVRLALTVGLMGGFTTYSTFNYETLQYLQQNDWLAACANVAATLLVCLAAGILGVLGGRLLAGS